MNEQHIQESRTDPGAQCHVIAEKAIQLYARGILMTVPLADQIFCEWQQMRRGEDQPSQTLLSRIAQRICSYALYLAWRSQDTELRNCAFDNLRRYLASSLQQSSYGKRLHDYAEGCEDVLQQTLMTLYLIAERNGDAGPDDPASFLKWAQTILIRQAHEALTRHLREVTVSLDEQLELFAERYVASDDSGDPSRYVLKQELQQVLGASLLAMSNCRYRSVLIYTYLVDMDERELATRLGVRLQDIYLWRHRALKALRSKPDVMLVLRSLRE